MTKQLLSRAEESAVRTENALETSRLRMSGIASFVDNRPEAVAQRQLQTMISNSTQVERGKAYQAMANASPRVRQARFMWASISGSAQLAARQRPFGPAPAVVSSVEEPELSLGESEAEPVQREQAAASASMPPETPAPNNTGLPDSLKAGIESLSGMRMDHVRVHYDSDKPAQLNAHAYAQGSEIHVAPGQNKHLPHEAWHVVQQAQGRVKPTMQKKGVPLNDDSGLEKEADQMGERASTHLAQEAPRRELLRQTAPVVYQRVVTPANKKKIGELSREQVIARMQNPPEEEEPGEIATAYLAARGKAGNITEWSNLIRDSGLLNTIDDEIPEPTINVSGIDYSLSELNRKPQEFYYTAEYNNLEEILTQLIEWDGELDDEESPADKKHVKDLKNKVQNATKIGEHLKGAEEGWLEKYGKAAGAGNSLHDLVYNVIVAAMAKQSSISGMSYDEIFGYNPETQLAYCLRECRDDTDEVLALCLYTSYFYEPLNKYFRGLTKPNESTNFGKLIVRTAKVLTRAYKSEDAAEIAGSRYRLELKSGWIKGDEEFLNFGALTSTHPNLAGVKGMWGDVANGTFGEYDQLALLIFEGTAKIKRPEKKYFDKESEDLMGPDSKYQIIDSYAIEGDIPGIGRKKIRVFRLSNSELSVPEAARLGFSDVI